MKLKTINYFSSIIFVSFLFMGCQQQKSKSTIKNHTFSEKADSVNPSGTNHTIVASQGKIASVNDAPVASSISGQIMQKLVKEGQCVTKGQVLFRLDDEDANLSIKELKRQLEQAEFKMNEILIGQGYKRAEFSQVPQRIVELAKTKSGYNVCLQQLKTAYREKERFVITAPISGVCVDVEVNNYEYIQPGKQLLHIVDHNHLKIIFQILESELRRLHIGTTVKVTTIAYPDETHQAHVSTINQNVNEDGMVRIEAVLEDTHNVLPGMTATASL